MHIGPLGDESGEIHWETSSRHVNEPVLRLPYSQRRNEARREVPFLNELHYGVGSKEFLTSVHSRELVFRCISSHIRRLCFNFFFQLLRSIF